MAIVVVKPNTAGQRGTVNNLHVELTKTEPSRQHLVKVKKHSGRNNTGRVTVRHRGGGAKRIYRLIDFKRRTHQIEGVLSSIEYDPNRSAYISLVKYRNGADAYILTPHGVKVGTIVKSGDDIEVKSGNAGRLASLPLGSVIHNIELVEYGGAKLVRSAGTYATLVAKNDNYATIKLPSGELRLIHLRCFATLGQVSNVDHRNVKLGKAGRSRWKGRRSTVRGAVMNACDHPHGGGEGKAPVGRTGPMTPWGKPAHGYKTRNKKNVTNRFILRRGK